MRKKIFIVIALFLSVFFSAGSSYAVEKPFYGDSFGIDPLLDWKVIETEHFKIHHDEKIKEVAVRVSQLYEEAHEILSPLMRWEASYKVSVILADNSDSANGLASAALRVGMVLFLTPPDNWSSIATYDDWLRLLILHEYTHFLNMDPTRGFWTAIRWIFGDAVKPNSLWTSWMLEGLAVYIETAYTKAGRGRSSEWDMVLRSAFQEKVLGTEKYITLDRMNGEYPYPPYGETVYFYGYNLMNQVTLDLDNKKRKKTFDKKEVLKNSEDILGLMSYRSAKRFPWLISGNLRNISGKGWSEYWEDFIALTKIRMREQLKKIESQKTTEVKLLTDREKNNSIVGLALAPNEEFLAYSKRDQDEKTYLYIRSLADQKEEQVFRLSASGSLSISSDSKKVFFSGLRRHDNYYTLSDIGVYDLEQDSTYWLTDEERVKDPGISPDGKFLAFSQIDKGTIFLAEAELEQTGRKLEFKNKKILFRGKLGSKVSTPVYSPDGSKIFFTFHDNQSSDEALAYYDRRTQTARVFHKDGSLNRFLTFRADGSLYYISNKSGVDNIYRYNFTQRKSEMMSNLITGARFPVITKSGNAYAAHYSYLGWDLASLNLTGTPLDVSALTIQAPFAPVSPAEVKETLSFKSYDFEEKEYSPWSSLLPRAWSPTLLPQNNGVYGGFSLTGFDTLDRHRYVLLAAGDSLTGQFDGQVVYNNRSFGPTVSLSVANYTSARSYIGYDLIGYTRTLSMSALISPPLEWTYSSMSPYFGVILEQDKEYDLADKSNPFYISPYIPVFAGGVSWSYAESFPLSISPQKGGILNLDGRVFQYKPDQTFKGFVSYQHFFHLGGNHVLTPVVGSSQTSHVGRSLSSSNVEAGGYSKNPFRFLGGLNLYSISGITLRGYPGKDYILKSVYFSTLEHRFPIYRIFRGINTRPFFFRNIYGFTFVDYLYIPLRGGRSEKFAAVGGGVRLTAQLLHLIPLTLSGEFHYGLNKRLGGKPEGVVALIFSPAELFTSFGSKSVQ